MVGVEALQLIKSANKTKSPSNRGTFLFLLTTGFIFGLFRLSLNSLSRLTKEIKMKNPFIPLILILVLLLVACGDTEATTETVTVKETIEVPVEVTRIVEQEVEVTRIVEQEIEVTRIVEVEVEKLVTATPLPPTATPDAPQVGSQQNPQPIGEPMSLQIADGNKQFTVTILETIRGVEALQLIKSANQFNDDPPDGFEFIMMLISVDYQSGQGQFEVDKYSISTVTNGRIFDYSDTFNYSPCCLEPDFDLQLLPGGSGEGWVAMPVALDDESPLMMLTDTEFFFSLTE